MEAKYKAQLGELQEDLQKEREQATICSGDNSEMKCKLAMLEEQLKDLKNENQEAKEKLADEKIAKAREVNHGEKFYMFVRKKHCSLQKKMQKLQN